MKTSRQADKRYFPRSQAPPGNALQVRLRLTSSGDGTSFMLLQRGGASITVRSRAEPGNENNYPLEKGLHMLAIWWDDPTLYLWLVGCVAFYFFVTPLLILSNQKMSASPVCEELQMHSLDPQIAQFLMQKTNALYELGFDEPTLIHLPGAVSGVKAYLIMLVNRPAGDKVMVTALVAADVLTIQTWYVEYSTRYATDQCVDTLNSSELSAFQQGPENIRSQVPSVTDVHELYRLHQYMMNKSNLTARKVLYEPGQAVAYLKEYALKKSYDKQVEKGWLRYDAAGDCYRPTVKGAYLMTWGLLQPMKWFRVQAMQSREREILKEFRAAT
ncbi:MAG: hypothetical protein QM703_27765 [Gemmatales bacterium]